MDELNRAVIVWMNYQGKLVLMRTLGDFSGDAIVDVLADLARGDIDVALKTAWRVPLEYDAGDPSVGLAALGYVLDWGQAQPLEPNAEFREYSWDEVQGAALARSFEAELALEQR